MARGLVRVQVAPPPTDEDTVVKLHCLARVRQSCCRPYDVRPHRCRVRGQVGKRVWSWWRLLWRVGALSAKPPSDSGWMNRCASDQLVYVDCCVIPSDLCMNGDNALSRSMMKARALGGKRSDTQATSREMLCQRLLRRSLSSGAPSKLEALQRTLKDGPTLSTFIRGGSQGAAAAVPPELPCTQMAVPAGELPFRHRCVPALLLPCGCLRSQQHQPVEGERREGSWVSIGVKREQLSIASELP